MPELTVLTFNIRHGVGTDDRLDLGRIAGIIARQRPDVVALQEVDRRFGARSDDVDQPAWLGEQLDMIPLFGPQLAYPSPKPGAPPQEYGTALLAARPVNSWDLSLLPTPAGYEGRVLLSAELSLGRTGAQAVRVCCTHLSFEDAGSRVAQVAAIAELVDPVSPTVLMGDLNADPESREIRYLHNHLTDSWQLAGCGDGYTFEAQHPDRRIDYILVSPNITVAETAVVPVDSGSDHRAVRATLWVDET